MRTVSSEVAAAMTSENGLNMNARLTIYKNRVYVESVERTAAGVAVSQDGVNYKDVHPQHVIYNSTYHCLVGITTDPEDDQLILMIKNQDGTISRDVKLTFGGNPLISHPKSRPAIYSNRFYFIDSTNMLNEVTLSATAFGAGGTGDNSVSAVTALVQLTGGGALHAYTDRKLALLHVVEGGVGIEIVSTLTGDLVSADHRIMFPDMVLDETDMEHISMLNFSAAALMNNNALFIYITTPKGDVLGVRYYANVWEDIYTAIPQDVCAFYITNAIHDSYQRLHLCGQFTRTGEFDTPVVHNLAFWSDDGKLFSMDRFTLFSTIGKRLFYVPGESSKLWIFDSMHYALVDGPFAVFRENAPKVQIEPNDIRSIQGNPGNGWKIAFGNASRDFYWEDLVDKGNVIDVELGILTGSTYQWTRMDRCIITRKTHEQMTRTYGLEMMHEGLWRISTITYPMYLELQSKQSVYDDVEALENLYRAEGGGDKSERFYIDFWNPENELSYGGLPEKSHAAGADPYVFDAGDVKTRLGLKDYPTIPQFPFDVKIYGWGRIGLPSTNPNTADDTPATALNDDVEPVFTVKRDGVETEVIITKDLTTKPYFPQTWKDGSTRIDGVCPIVYTLDEGCGLNPGEEVIKVGVRFSSVDPTVFYPERIEVPQMGMHVEDAIPQEWEAVDKPPAEPTPNDPATEGSITPHSIYTSNWVVELYYPVPGTEVAQWKYLTKSSVQMSEINWTGNEFTTSHLGWTIDEASYPDAETLVEDTPGYLIVEVLANLVTPRSDGVAPEIAITLENNGLYDGINWQRIVGGGNTAVVRNLDGTVTFTLGGLGGAADWARENMGFALKIEDRNVAAGVSDAVCTFAITKVAWQSYDEATQQYDGPLHTFFGSTPTSPPVDDDPDTIDYVYRAKGTPSVLFSQTPYTTWNFELTGAYEITGVNSWFGLVGLATDGANYVCARINANKLQLIKVREGMVAGVLAELPMVKMSGTMMFRHVDGDFYVSFLNGQQWDPPVLTYRWLAADGAMVANMDVMHVGTYSFVDTPCFRTCGFDANSASVIGLLPGYDSSALDNFPSMGVVEINGIKYNYSDKIVGDGVQELRGPFQVRNATEWEAHTNTSDGQSYGGKSCEFTFFEWKNGDVYRSQYAGYLMVSNAGYGWPISDVEWKTATRTDGQVVWLLNRGRFYSNAMGAQEAVSTADKIWVTIGLTGVSTAEGEPGFHGEGQLVFLDDDSSVKIISFTASSGHKDATVADLIQHVSQIGGSIASFPGDVVVAEKVLTAGERWRVL